MSNGKGDRRRPGKGYGKGYNLIFNKKKEKKKNVSQQN